MLAILSTHPIQYQVPLWQALAREGSVPFEVWYLSDHATRTSLDEGFGKAFAWDLDMLKGYPYRFLKVNPNGNVNSFTGLRLQESLPRLFLEKQVTALWIQGWQVLAYWQAVWQAQAAGIPVWVRGESNDLGQSSFLKKAIKRQVLGQLFRRIQHFLYIGRANRRLYESYGIRAEQLHPAPYCVDNARFARQAEELLPDRSAIRKAWNIPKDAFCILFAGKFVEKKRPWDIIAALAGPHLETLGRPLHLLFVGSGELGRKLREKCRVVFDAESESTEVGQKPNGCNKSPAASFAGFLKQTEISKAYVAADCMVLPSDSGETWGLVVNEALASGLPCITSNACGCTEDLIAPIDPGFRFNVGDTRDITRALQRLLEQPYPSTVWKEQAARFSLATSVSTVAYLYRQSPVCS
jgi:glycosyltransferase involved in cell wall biosynthesis